MEAFSWNGRWIRVRGRNGRDGDPAWRRPSCGHRRPLRARSKTHLTRCCPASLSKRQVPPSSKKYERPSATAPASTASRISAPESIGLSSCYRVHHCRARRHRSNRLGDSQHQYRDERRRARRNIIVTGESPVVDLQSAERETVLTNDVIKAIPTAGSYNALLVLVPALLGGQQDVSTGPCNSCTFSAHGRCCPGRQPRQHRGTTPGRRHQHRGAAGRWNELS